MKAKRKSHKLLSLLLCCAVLVGMMPMATGTALAENGKPAESAVNVDGNKAFGSPGRLYYKNSDPEDNFTGRADDYNAHYDPDTGVLTLKDYSGGDIVIGGATAVDITIKLEGTNTVTGSIINNEGGDINITAEDAATLTLNVTSADSYAYGIACDISNGHTDCSRAITISGKAKVNVNATATSTDYNKSASGIYTPGTVTIEGDASFQAVCKSATTSDGANSAAGIYGAGGVTINTTGNVNIDVSQCSGAYNYGIYGSPSNSLTKVTEMTIKWKQTNTSGAPEYPAKSFDSAATTHAINVDTTNHVATYRHGTPYTVTVYNGSCDAANCTYLEEDTVNVTAENISELTFKKWISADVTVAGETSSTTTFTMPAKNVTLTADYHVFTVQPQFTRSSSSAGSIAFTLVKLPDSGDVPKLVEKESDTVVGYTYFNGDELARSKTVYDGYGDYNVPGGEYRVAVQYNSNWFYSDVFTVDYSDTPTLPAYTGTAAAAPVLSTKQGGNVTLQAVTVADQSVEYGYSTSNDKGTAAHWQDAVEFTGLAAGDYYFFARVKASGEHSGGGVSEASGKITVFAKPQITDYSGSLDDLTIDTAITEITPMVTVPATAASAAPYAMTGTLPAGLAFDTATGKISGTPTTFADIGGTVSITVTDAEGTVSEKYPLSYGQVKKKTQEITASDVTATYGDTDKSVSATATGSVSYAVKGGYEEYIDVASDGKLTLKKAGEAFVVVTAAETETYAQATKEVKITISAKSVMDDMIASVENQTYTGSSIKPEPQIKDGETDLTKGTDFDYSYESNEYAGTAKVKITGKGNYTGTAGKTFTITAAQQSPTITPLAELKKGGKTLDLSTLITGVKGGADVSFSIAEGTAATISGTTLTTGDSAGTVEITVTIAAKDINGDSTPEYAEYTKTNAITVTVNDKDAQEALSISSAKEVTYGKTLKLTTTGGSGTGDVTYQIVSGGTGEATISADTLTATKAGTVKVIAKKAGDADYNAVTSAAITITIARADPTGTPAYTKITEANKTLADAALAIGTLQPDTEDYTLKWVKADGSDLADTTVVEKNTKYKWLFTPKDTTNYNTLSGEIELYHVASSGGGGGGSYTPVTPTTPTLDKAKADSTAAISTAASANKYDAAEQAEVKKIVDKANADIKNAKTEAEVKAIQEAAQAEIDKILTTAEKAEIAAVGNVERKAFETKSKATRLNGKKAIRLTWIAPAGIHVDGYEIFRSTKKNAGYGTEPFFTTTKTSYTNNKDLKAGKTYYYKVRAFVIINGEKVYTDFSLKAWRKI